MKYFLFIFSFIITEALQAQRSMQATAGAIISASIISDVVGVEKKGDIIFSGINSGEKLLITSVSNVLNVIGNESAYSISVSEKDVLVKKFSTGETMKLDSFTINSFKENKSDQSFYAAVHMNNKHSAGIYTSVKPLTIIVNYN